MTSSMKRVVLVLVGIVAACVALSAQTPEVQKVLTEIKAKDKGLLAVSEEDGRFLRLMVASKKAKNALEIGGASGYRAIWIGIGLRGRADDSSPSSTIRFARRSSPTTSSAPASPTSSRSW